MLEKQRLMGLDVGEARVGVALSDLLGLGATPYKTVEIKGKKIFQELLDISLEQNVSTIVVGLPVKLSGEMSEQSLKVKKFIETLEKAIPQNSNIKIETWDERLTTVQAEKIMQGSKLKNRKKSAALDAISAAIILETYMSAKEKLTNCI